MLQAFYELKTLSGKRLLQEEKVQVYRTTSPAVTQTGKEETEQPPYVMLAMIGAGVVVILSLIIAVTSVLNNKKQSTEPAKKYEA